MYTIRTVSVHTAIQDRHLTQLGAKLQTGEINIYILEVRRLAKRNFADRSWCLTCHQLSYQNSHLGVGRWLSHVSLILIIF